jgi:triacylglycerol lipase
MTKPLPPAKFHQIRPPNANYNYFEDRAAHPFQSAATDFQLVNAGWLADFALLAYGHREFIQQIFNQSGLAADGFTFQFFDAGSTSSECFVAHNDKFVVAAFRGTEIDNFFGAFMDWVLDLEFRLVPDPSGGLVHDGFQHDIDSIWPAVKAHLQQLQADGTRRTLWLTGHSLGAALATLAAERAARDGGFEVGGVYTYGSPRVGDARFKQAYAARGLDARTYRFVFNIDVVPKAPPPILYTHVGALKFIDSAGHVHELANEADASIEPHLSTHAQAFLHQLSFLGHDALALFGGIDRIIIPAPLADHAPIYYASHIWNNL